MKFMVKTINAIFGGESTKSMGKVHNLYFETWRWIFNVLGIYELQKHRDIHKN